MCKTYIDPESGVIVVYGEYYQKDKLIPEHAANLLPEIRSEELKGIRTYGGIKGDSSGKNRELNTGKSNFDNYKDNGIKIYSASNLAIETGINAMLSHGKRSNKNLCKLCKSYKRVTGISL